MIHKGVTQAFDAYLFDVDGTLVDSAADICGAIQGVLQNGGHPAASLPFLRRYIGRHLTDLFEDLFPSHTAEQNNALIEEYRRLYPARGHSSTRLYPQAVETLARLGGRKSTATTKGTPTTKAVLEQFGLLPYFQHVQGTDGFPAKPHPDVLLKAMEGLGVRPEQCLFIGDSCADMEAARRAGIRVCAATYGYGDRAELARWEPDYWIDALSDLAFS